MEEATFIQELVLTIFVLVIAIICFYCGVYVGSNNLYVGSIKQLQPDDGIIHMRKIDTNKTICGIYCMVEDVDLTTQWRWVTCDKCLKFKYTQG